MFINLTSSCFALSPVKPLNLYKQEHIPYIMLFGIPLWLIIILALALILGWKIIKFAIKLLIVMLLLLFIIGIVYVLGYLMVP